jgi:hypothetical protein
VLNDYKKSKIWFLWPLFSNFYWIVNSNSFDNVALKSISLIPKYIDNIANCLNFFRKRTRPGSASSTAASPSSSISSSRGRSSTQTPSSVGGHEKEDVTVSEAVFVTERQYLVEPTTPPIRYTFQPRYPSYIPAVSFAVFPLLNIEVNYVRIISCKDVLRVKVLLKFRELF